MLPNILPRELDEPVISYKGLGPRVSSKNLHPTPQADSSLTRQWSEGGIVGSGLGWSRELDMAWRFLRQHWGEKLDVSLSMQVPRLPTHLSSLAHRAYWALMSQRKDQSIVTLGRSGAGKTACCEQVLEQLVVLAGSVDGRVSGTEPPGVWGRMGSGYCSLSPQCTASPSTIYFCVSHHQALFFHILKALRETLS